jgi:hypothetical protein
MEHLQDEKTHEKTLKFEIGKPESYFYFKFERSQYTWAMYTPVRENSNELEELNG